MELIDPLFQRTLIQHCKEARIPVILDEVFAGIWRLGRETAAELLGCTPDVACYAKLLTGGMLPLAVTLATEVGSRGLRFVWHSGKPDCICWGQTPSWKSLACRADSLVLPSVWALGTQIEW